MAELHFKQLKNITLSNFNRYSDRPILICMNNNQGDKKLQSFNNHTALFILTR